MMSTNNNVLQHSTRDVICFSYSLLCYGATLVSLISLIVFVTGVCTQLDVNAAPDQTSTAVALISNLALVSLFGIQHSVMARKRFKIWLLRYIDPSVERSTYCLASAVVILVMVFFWQPMEGDLWRVEDTYLVFGIQMFAVTGWLILLLATFQLDHFELFGLRQTFERLRLKPARAPAFKTPGLYRWVRHPIQLGVLMGVWAVPVSTAGHTVFAASLTLYVLIGLYFEEQDLIAEFGDTYREYKERVAKLIPFTG